MSTAEPTETRTLPPLVAGQRLDRATFHARYEAMPSGIKFELIGGVVWMASPLLSRHSRPDQMIAGWLIQYQRFTPGLWGGSNQSTILGDDSEPQPDNLMRIISEAGGHSRLVEGYVEGPPELVVEVSRSSRSFDLGPKRAAYERAGVSEYLVIAPDQDEARWFVLREGRFADLVPGPDGLIRSEVFPGLWLDPDALFDGDLSRLFAALDQGLATPEHAEFAARLAASPNHRRKASP